MRKIVLTFGLISGLVVITLMLVSISFMRGDNEFESGEIMGYLSMIVSLSAIFFGVKSYRDGHLNGKISFGKGFLIGLYITLVAGVIYVVGWEIYYHTSYSDFAEKYTAYSIQQVKDSGLTGEALDKKIDELKSMQELYTNNPFFRIAMTFTEILPVGLLISLISAAILRKKEVLPV